jgi:MFS family permease
MEPSPRFRSIRARIYTAQSFYAVAFVMLTDSPVFILYAALLGGSEFIGLVTTSLLPLARGLVTPFFALLVDRIGKRRVFLPCLLFSGFVFISLAAIPWLPGARTGWLLLLLSVYVFLYAAAESAWFPLLRDLVPPAVRGSFFGGLRATWTAAAMAVLFVIGLWIGRNARVEQLQVVVAAAGLFLLVRLLLVWPLRETPALRPDLTLRAVVLSLLRHKRLFDFCIYLFVLYLLAGSILPMIYVLARTALHMPDNFLVNLSSLVMLANIAGYYLSGRVVDRWGTRGIFLAAHFGFGLICLALLSVNAGQPPLYNQIALAGLAALYGLLYAAASVAVTTDLFGLAPTENQATGIAFGLALYQGGLAAARFGSAWVLARGILNPQWHWLGMELTAYHAILLVAGCGVVGAVVLLTLVPSLMAGVRHDAQA